MKYLNIFFMMLFVSTAAFSQTLTPKFGFEVGASLKNIDNIGLYNSLAPSTSIGFYTRIPLNSERFYAKFGAGLNLTFVHGEEVEEYVPQINDYYTFDEDNSAIATMSVIAELRYNLLPANPSRGNLFITLPLTLESAPINKWEIIRPELRIVPGIGYRYEFNNGWNIEVNAGYGYGRYLNNEYNNGNPSTQEYTASLRLGYTF